MNTLRLFANVIDVTTTFEPLAVLDVVSDTFSQDSDRVRRDVVSTIRERFPAWAACIGLWHRPLTDRTWAIGFATVSPHKQPVTVKERTYVYVLGALQLDEVIYSTGAWLNVEDDTLRLTLSALHYGTLDEYHEKIASRRRWVENLIAHAHAGRFTKNDYRDLILGLPRDPQFDGPFPAEEMSRVFASPKWQELTRVYAA